MIQEQNIKLPVTIGKITKKLPVFYNPRMKFNRDFTILLIKALNLKDLRIGLPLAGSGIRAFRMLAELNDYIKEVHINDIRPNFYDNIQQTLNINNLKADKLSVYNFDANKFLMQSKGFDFIDIDPFGSPNPFLNNAVLRLSRRGILAVTATDTAALTGTYPKATERNYYAKIFKTPQMFEFGLRILIRKVQLIGMQYNRALLPIFAYSKDHYFRIFFVAHKSKKKANAVFNEIGYVKFCEHCNSISTAKNIFNDGSCEMCGSKLKGIGPMWLGNLFDKDISNKIRELNTDLISKEDERFFNILIDEALSNINNFYYDIPSLAKRYKINQIPLKNIISKLNNQGKRTVRSHFTNQAIKSTASLGEILKSMANN